MGDAEHWLREIYSSHWSARFRRYCTQKYARFSDPEQLMEEARQDLALSLQRAVARGDAASMTEAYVMVAFRNAVTDLNRRQNGRAEPRPWLKAFGRLGQLLFELYCLARYRRADVIAAIETDPSLQRQRPTAQQAHELMTEMDQRGECEGKGRREESLFDDSGEAHDIPYHATPERELMDAQSEALQAYLFRREEGTFSSIQHLVERIQSARGGLQEPLQLDDDQRFILHATLSGQLTEEEMGRMLGGLSVRQVRYKRQKALESMRMLVERLGLGLEELLGDDSAIIGIGPFASMT